jgi:cytochrome c oxidase subunit 1/cytochrome c oxidase subunit I+III
MPRREYTYPDGLGWQVYNVIETAGSYVLAAGLLLVAANLGVSLFRGRLAGNDPWGGDTLEWSTTSPPPPYNYPVIPVVTSPYPMWDLADREADARRLERGELTLEGGHETLGSSVLDAEPVEVLEMPAESPWPILLALMLAGAFALVLTTHYGSALVFVGLAAVVLAAWHWKEPETA